MDNRKGTGPARFALATDDELITSIVMHPQVRRWNAPDDAPAFDAAAYTAHPKSFAIMVEGGCFLAMALEQSAYAIHTNFLPASRGAHAVHAAREALQLAFLVTDAEQLTTMVPLNNPQALRFAHSMGFRDSYRRANAWTSAGKKYDMQYLSLAIDDWIVASQECAQAGIDFHQRLEGVDHPDDPVHDAFVGAAIEMITYRRADKAQRIYGRWARAAGYRPFEIVSHEPLCFDIGARLLRVSDEQLTTEEK